jgi:small subunit ribosomal protein S16
MLKLRLKRYGKKREPSYRIIAIESRSRRQARPLEELGFYNPRTKETVLETAGLLKWLRQGAQPTETLESILRKAGILEMLKAGKAGTEEGLETLRIPAIAKILPVIEEIEEEPAVVEAEAETSDPATLEPEVVAEQSSGEAEPAAEATSEVTEEPTAEASETADATV